MKSGGKFIAAQRWAFQNTAPPRPPVRPVGAKKGKLTPAQAMRIRAKANAILGGM